MSDLFCAATLVVARSGADEENASETGRQLGVALSGRRVAAVWTSASGASEASAAAQVLGLPVRVHPELGEPTGVATALEELADTFRGETVLVVGEQPLAEGLLASATNAAGLTDLFAGELAEAEVDADGLVLRRWAGVPVV